MCKPKDCSAMSAVNLIIGNRRGKYKLKGKFFEFVRWLYSIITGCCLVFMFCYKQTNTHAKIYEKFKTYGDRIKHFKSTLHKQNKN